MTSLSSPIQTARLATMMFCLLAFGACAGQAADPDNWDDLFLDEDQTTWFLRGGPRALFNVKANISQIHRPVQTGRYDNGYVEEDISGSNSAQTWNWGYQDASQIDGNLLWQSRIENTPQAGQWRDETDMALGGEIIIGTELFRFEMLGKTARFGVEMGYAFNQFSVEEQSRATGIATLNSSAYDTGGIVVPTAPYSGSFNGPGPLINLNPSISSSINSPSQSTFDGELESDLHTLNLGFWLQYPITERFLVSGSFGYAAIYADTELSYTESTSFDNPSFVDTGLQSKSIGSRDWRPGMYTEIRLEYPLSKEMVVYLGTEFQLNKDQEFSGEGREVTLDFGAQFSVSGGLGFKF